ncbi:Bgt-4397 [Blumeria graminis f. sp. tritici]|uniref:Bgt-4397 n=1 Tax=Blumeria graminis f. sp. tritici TaxID=62690 RepID=A0A9X9L813_BLUGR|nr:Bgt-4397 [Blumeria graminis f. sp. tritici]
MALDASAQQLLYETGSLTGYRASDGELGSHYLSSTFNVEHSFCGNLEGWGPLSPYRYDFTPCFMDVWVGIVAIYGISFGALAVFWLYNRKETKEVQKDWHFWTKQVSEFNPLRENCSGHFAGYTNIFLLDYYHRNRIFNIISAGMSVNYRH